MKSNYQNLRNKRRLAFYLIKLSTRGEVVNMNLRKLLNDIYKETGEIFARTEFGVVFEAFMIIDCDEVCNPENKVSGCGDGYNPDNGICSSVFHKPKVPICIPSLVEKYPEDFNPFPGNLITVASILPIIKPLSGLRKRILVTFRRDFGDTSL